MATISRRHVGRETTCDTFFEDEAGNPVKETWRFARWDLGIWTAFADWAKTVLPDPVAVGLKNLDAMVLKDAEILRQLQIADAKEFERVKALNQEETAKAQRENREPQLTPWIQQAPAYTANQQVSEVVVKRLADKACCYLDSGSEELIGLLRGSVGTAHLFHLLLKPHHPDMTPELAFEIVQAIGQGEVDRVLSTVQGRLKAKPKNEPAPAA